MENVAAKASTIHRPILAVFSALVFLVLVLPTLLVRGCMPSPPRRTDLTVSLYLTRSHRPIRLGLEEYLVGVLAAEMPARFSLEALKAQAIAARTLTVRRMKRFGGRGCRHLNTADLCDDPSDGQAWLADTDLRRLWGWRYGGYRAKIARAVAETRGLVLLYDHRLIDAAYHSTCGGRTEDASSVWARGAPYLVSVACGFDRFSPRYSSVTRYHRDDLARKLGVKLPASGAALTILGRTDSGRVASVQAGGKVFSGTEFRAALNLGSTNFDWRAESGDLVFLVKGYGHGVGLCQYGAEGMARKNANCYQILRHYYTGITLGKLKQ